MKKRPLIPYEEAFNVEVLSKDEDIRNKIEEAPQMQEQIYLSSSEENLRPVNGVEKPVFYLSRLIKGYELNYSAMEKHCLALVYTTQKFRYYFLAHLIHLMTKSDPIRFLIKRPILSGRLKRWALILAEFEINPMLPKAIRSQTLTDLLALLPSENHEPIDDGLPGEFLEVAMCEEVRPWVLYFDGSLFQLERGAGVVLTSLDGKAFPLSYKLAFTCTNNEAKYEALVLGLSIAKEMGIQHILIKGDSNLVVKQVTGQFGVKKLSLASYRERVFSMAKAFKGIKFQHVPRAEKKQLDALASFGAKVQLGEDQAKTFTTIKRTQPHSVLNIPCYVTEEDDWRRSIIQKLMSLKTSSLATLKEFYLRDNQLYKKSSDGLLMRCVSHEEGTDKLIDLHESTCGLEGPCLYRRMQRVGLYWPTMKENCDQFQAKCLECREHFEIPGVCFVSIQGDWRRPYIEYIRDRTLPLDVKEASVVKKKAAS
ncbi:reverse transcriptase [Senna tora]|uniref:Reverse transcriptase n=1 Tax=Senna tora TaxID=362788 RepID=A0A834TH25_9FABA|nr:reverse transcriptase [Senna tora]